MTQLELFKENFNTYKDIDKIDVSEILDLNNEKKFPELQKDHFILYKTGRDDFILQQMGKVFPGLYNSRTGKFLKPRLRGCGANYRMWMIRGTYDGKKFMYDIECHRMVALAFINNPDPIKKTIVNHIDTVKENYRVDNLQWVTRRENSLGQNVDKGIIRRRELELIEKFNTKELDLSKVELYQNKARKELEALKKDVLELMSRNIIFGPPGTGKTTHLLRIVEKELKENNVPPNRIAYLAFTNQAADEALSRAISQLNYSIKDFMNFRTLHSLAYRELHLREENIMSDEDYKNLSNKLQIKLSNPNNSVKKYGAGFPDDVFMQVIDGAKIRGLTTENFFNDPKIGHLEGGLTKLKYIDEALNKYKQVRNKYDMTDMIVDFNKKHYDLMPKFDVVIVDEAQDLSWLQWKMIERIIGNAKRVYIAGDDDQAIYLWAGARPEFLINMEGKRTILNKSYRLPHLIHAKANKLIKRIEDRVDKEWTSRDDMGEVNIYPTERLSNLKKGDWLILARDRYRLSKLEEDLKIYGYYFERDDETSISDRIRRSIITWEDLRKGKSVDLKSVRSCYTYIQTGEGVAKEFKGMRNADSDKLYTFDMLQKDFGLKVSKEKPWFEALKNIPITKSIYIRAVLRRGENIRRQPRIKLSTIHGSKGGEADNVMLLTDLTRKADAEYWRQRDQERRVFYVGMTRARNTLNIVRSQSDREFSEVF